MYVYTLNITVVFKYSCRTMAAEHELNRMRRDELEKNKKSDLIEKVITLESEIDDLQTTLMSEQGSSNATKQQLLADKGNLTSQLQDIRVDKDVLAQQVRNLTGEKAAIETDKGNLIQQVQQLTNDNSRLLSEKGDLNQQVQSLTYQISVHVGEKSLLEDKVNELDQQKTQAVNELLTAKSLSKEKEDENQQLITQMLTLKNANKPAKAKSVLLWFPAKYEMLMKKAENTKWDFDYTTDIEQVNKLSEYKMVVLLYGWHQIRDGVDSDIVYQQIQDHVLRIRQQGPEVALVHLPPSRDIGKTCQLSMINVQLRQMAKEIAGVQVIWVKEFKSLPSTSFVKADGEMLEETEARIGVMIAALDVPADPAPLPASLKRSHDQMTGASNKPSTSADSNNNSYQSNSNSYQSEEIIHIPDRRYVGRIIGKAGANVREMEERTHTRIKVTECEIDNKSVKVVKVSGSDKAVRKAVQELRDIMSSPP